MNAQEFAKNTNENDELSLKELILKTQEWISFFWSKKITIALVSMIGAILGFLYAKSKVPIYTASTNFVLEEGGGGMAQYAGLASMMGLNVGGSGGGIFEGGNIIELYKSHKMIEKTLLTSVNIAGENKLLINLYIELNSLRDKWKNNPQLEKVTFNSARNTSFNRVQDSIILRIVEDINKNYLSVDKPDKKLSIIQVTIRAKDENFAKIFNEQLVNNVNRFYIDTKTKKSLEQINILQRKTDSVRTVMNGAIYKVASVNDATPNINPTKQTLTVVPSQKAQFSVETNKAILSELIKNLELTKIAMAKETPLIQSIDTPLLPLKKQKTSTLKGVLLGAFIFGFLSCFVCTIRKIYHDIMNTESEKSLHI